MTARPELVALLEARIGLDAESIGLAAIERAVRQRIAACGAPDEPRYWERLQGSEAELQELVECLVVPETWFFRDREALLALGRLALERWPRRRELPLRLLSLPCSTGEEPYSMAMTLLDAGLDPERFRVDAVDISARALALARRAVYGRNSFRGGDLGFRDRYFERRPNGHHLVERVRACVEFRQDNVLDLTLSRPAHGYDFIFCRNVLIYFALPAQRRALETLRDLLGPGGLVFVGPAETSLMMRHDYAPAKIPLAFAFRAATGAHDDDEALRPASPPLPRRPSSRRRSASAPPLSRRPSSRAAVAPSPSRPSPPAKDKAESPAADPAMGLSLADVEQLADQGRLREAAQACDALLREHDTDASIYYLAGVVHGALGDGARAAELYRKAVYLDPLHADALAHLAYLLEAEGELSRAGVFRDRARRARERHES